MNVFISTLGLIELRLFIGCYSNKVVSRSTMDLLYLKDAEQHNDKSPEFDDVLLYSDETSHPLIGDGSAMHTSCCLVAQAT